MRTHFSEDIIPVGDLKLNPGKVLKHAGKTGRAILVTSHGRGVAVIESLSEYELNQEKMEFMKAVVKGVAEADNGTTLDLDEVKKRLFD